MEDNKHTKTIRQTFGKYFVWLLLGLGLGGSIGAIAGLFMHAQHHLNIFLWEVIPNNLGGMTSLHILLTCMIGGLMIGVGRKYLGDHPQPMETVLQSIKTGQNMPGIKTIPAAFILSLISLGFGAALGPEAALIGIGVGFSSWAGDILAWTAEKMNLTDLQIPWAKFPGYLAMASGFGVFILTALPIFSTPFSYFPYQFSLSGVEIVIATGLGIGGYFLGETFTAIGRWLEKLLVPIQEQPILTGFLGGILLGILGMVSPLILFSGQIGLTALFENGLEMGGLVLILIGLLKMIATKSNTATGWKGGEFFPVMFASAAIGTGIANLIPGINPMMAVAALMAATVTNVMDSIFIALGVVILFLPAKLIIPMLAASLVAHFLKKRLSASPELIAQEVPVRSKRS